MSTITKTYFGQNESELAAKIFDPSHRKIHIKLVNKLTSEEKLQIIAKDHVDETVRIAAFNRIAAIDKIKKSCC